jgi:hypothetical protein
MTAVSRQVAQLGDARADRLDVAPPTSTLTFPSPPLDEARGTPHPRQRCVVRLDDTRKDGQAGGDLPFVRFSAGSDCT